jgi:osmotically-inducible protein OsmY
MRGSVRTKAQHTRVLQLARETAGVTAVVDEVVVTAR